MKLTFKNVFAKTVLLSVFAFALVFVSMPREVKAAADIAISTAVVNSANTILVTFVNPGHNLASVDFTKWHIDVGGGGATPLTPTSAAVTSAGSPYTVTLTFAGTPFSNTATAYAASVGLYADASAVTDTNADTNAVVGHAASIAIADGQKPTFTAARTALNTIVLTFSETVDAADTATAAWTVAGATVTVATDPGSTTTLTLTTTGLTSTSSTPAVNYVATSGTVADVSAATNEVANGGAVSAADQVAPTLAVTLSDTDLDTGETMLVTFTFSEAPTGFTSADVTVQNGTLGTIDTTDPLIQTATFTPTEEINALANTVSVATTWTDSAAALTAPVGVSTSATYDIHTINSGNGGGGGGGGSSKKKITTTPTVVTPAVGATCPTGMMYNATTGVKCTVWVGVTPNTGEVTMTYAFGTTLVKQGSKGEACKAWQMFFNNKGNAGLVTDGMCGPKTMTFAKSWQASAGLTADGLLGAMSRAKAMMQ